MNSNSVALDPRLRADCLPVGLLDGVRLLLLDNALVPWFILVPDTTVSDIVDLEPSQRNHLFDLASELGRMQRTKMACERANIAAIGNVVSQLHVHIVGRRADDFCWPGVVWGRPEREAYAEKQVAAIRSLITECFGDRLAS